MLHLTEWDHCSPLHTYCLYDTILSEITSAYYTPTVNATLNWMRLVQPATHLLSMWHYTEWDHWSPLSTYCLCDTLLSEIIAAHYTPTVHVTLHWVRSLQPTTHLLSMRHYTEWDHCSPLHTYCQCDTSLSEADAAHCTHTVYVMLYWMRSMQPTTHLLSMWQYTEWHHCSPLNTYCLCDIILNEITTAHYTPNVNVTLYWVRSLQPTTHLLSMLHLTEWDWCSPLHTYCQCDT